MATATDTGLDAFLDALPAERRIELLKVRQAILDVLPEGYRECMLTKMLGYVIPHVVYPAGYHCNPKQPLMLGALAATKAGFSFHLMSLYWNEKAVDQLRDAFAAAGKKLDMGQACIRFKTAEDLDLPSIQRHLAETSPAVFIERYEEAIKRPREAAESNSTAG